MGSRPERSESHAEAQASIGEHHVCICVDGSPVSSWTLPHGLAMARAFGASPTVLQVLEAPRGEGTRTSTNPLEWEMRRTDARRHLDGISKEHGSPELPINTELLEGRVAEEIYGWVTSNHVDLTVLCSHGVSGWTDRGLASTAKKLVEGLSGPTLLVPACVLQELPKREVIYERILVPLDASPRAESGLPLAIRLARMHGSELVLIHVVPVPELTRPEPLDEEELELERRLIDRNTRVAESYLARLRGRLIDQGLRVRTVLAHDEVRFELLNCIKEERPSLIVISGHGRSGRTALRLGSVASFLLEHAVAPTLIARERKDPTDVRRCEAAKLLKSGDETPVVQGVRSVSGNTEFQFKVADLNFKSTSYDQMVIAGSKAKFKGNGTINGEGNYGFMLSAVDGDPKGGDDTFRIKIWDKNNMDVVVYDNQMGEADDADATTTLGGGSIVVHKAK